jgi:hypothetical protein
MQIGIEVKFSHCVVYNIHSYDSFIRRRTTKIQIVVREKESIYITKKEDQKEEEEAD